jgi:phosphate transport system permease protein
MTSLPTPLDAQQSGGPAAAASPRRAPIRFERDARARRQGYLERLIETILFLAAASSVFITIGIVVMLVYESWPFFARVGLVKFLFDTEWTPLLGQPRYGIWGLLSGTITTTLVALFVAVPIGTISAIWLSEYCPPRTREIVKPVLELLSAVPTVVYGYFALLFITPILQRLLGAVGIELPGFNMLSAGFVMGIMIIPYVASLSEDAMRAVPMSLREGSFAMGATRLQTAWRVVVPAAFSGVTAAYILGIARAVGETMIVAIAAGNMAGFHFNPLSEGQTITAYIVSLAKGDQPHGSIEYRTIFAAGLTLLVLTLVFNVAGYLIRKRYREA